MTEKQQAAMRQAIDALLTMIVMAHDWLPENLEKPRKAITALRQALEQQPAAWVGLNWGDLPFDNEVNHDFLAGAVWAETRLREKNGSNT